MLRRVPATSVATKADGDIVALRQPSPCNFVPPWSLPSNNDRRESVMGLVETLLGVGGHRHPGVVTPDSGSGRRLLPGGARPDRDLARKTPKNDKSEGQDMTATLEHIDAARAHRLATATLRLRLKPPHRSCGFVQGAWWPRSTVLASELPSLLRALAPRFGVIDRVHYHQPSWSLTPPSITYRNVDVMLDAGPELPNVITVFGKQFGKLALLVIPPYTGSTESHTAMATAARAYDASTPDQRLGLSERDTRDRRQARIALQRWESEGAALGDGACRS